MTIAQAIFGSVAVICLTIIALALIGRPRN